MRTLMVLIVIGAAIGCGKVSPTANRKVATANELYEASTFTTRVPKGWVINSPSGKIKFQIGRLVPNSQDGYDAIIRLDAGTPTDDLEETIETLKQRFSLDIVDSNFDWAGQSSILLSGLSSSHMKPHKAIATIRGDQLYLLFGSCDEGGNIKSEWKCVLDNWQWSQ